MKKVLGLAAAGLLAVSSANAGSITIGHTDMNLYGGISASLNINGDRTVGYDTNGDGKNDASLKDSDLFTVDTYAIGLMKPATADSPVGFNLALAGFWVKLADGRMVKSFAYDTQLYLGYFSLMPAEGLTIDAGLLWQKFGEAPISILNKHVTRNIAFAYQPVLHGGLRITYSNDMFEAYVGYNNDTPLGGTHKDQKKPTKYAVEAGATVKLDVVNLGAHIWQSEQGNDIIDVSVGTNLGDISLKAEYMNAKSGAKNAFNTTDSFTLYAGLNLGMIELPVRYEYIKVKKASGTNSANFITVTPTIHPSDNSYVRLEVAYGSGDKGLANGLDATKKSSTTIIAEFGFLF